MAKAISAVDQLLSDPSALSDDSELSSLASSSPSPPSSPRCSSPAFSFDPVYSSDAHLHMTSHLQRITSASSNNSPFPSPPRSRSSSTNRLGRVSKPGSRSSGARKRLNHTGQSKNAGSATKSNPAGMAKKDEQAQQEEQQQQQAQQPPTKRRRVASKPKAFRTLDLNGSAEELGPGQKEALELLLKTLRKKKKIVVIAGAGISVSAGIPDFRSSHGLFTTLKRDHKLRGASGKALFDASVYSHSDLTNSFHDMVRNLSTMASGAQPTLFHHLMATLAKEGRLLRLYTQNVDGIETSLPPLKTEVPLDTKPPWPKTIQLHGGLDVMVCQKCSHTSPFRPELFLGPHPPACQECENIDETRRSLDQRSRGVGRLRPRIVLYNEFNPDEEAIGSVVTADLRSKPDALIVVGTSMKIPGVRRMVKEFGNMVREARKDGVTVWINRDETGCGANAFEWDLVVRGECDEVARLAALKRWDEEVNAANEVAAGSSDAEAAKDKDGFQVCTTDDIDRIKREHGRPEVIITQTPKKKKADDERAQHIVNGFPTPTSQDESEKEARSRATSPIPFRTGKPTVPVENSKQKKTTARGGSGNGRGRGKGGKKADGKLQQSIFMPGQQRKPGAGATAAPAAPPAATASELPVLSSAPVPRPSNVEEPVPDSIEPLPETVDAVPPEAEVSRVEERAPEVKTELQPSPSELTSEPATAGPSHKGDPAPAPEAGAEAEVEPSPALPEPVNTVPVADATAAAQITEMPSSDSDIRAIEELWPQTNVASEPASEDNATANETSAVPATQPPTEEPAPVDETESLKMTDTTEAMDPPPIPALDVTAAPVPENEPEPAQESTATPAKEPERQPVPKEEQVSASDPAPAPSISTAPPKPTPKPAPKSRATKTTKAATRRRTTTKAAPATTATTTRSKTKGKKAQPQSQAPASGTVTSHFTTTKQAAQNAYAGNAKGAGKPKVAPMVVEVPEKPTSEASAVKDVMSMKRETRSSMAAKLNASTPQNLPTHVNNASAGSTASSSNSNGGSNGRTDTRLRDLPARSARSNGPSPIVQPSTFPSDINLNLAYDINGWDAATNARPKPSFTFAGPNPEYPITYEHRRSRSKFCGSPKLGQQGVGAGVGMPLRHAGRGRLGGKGSVGSSVEMQVQMQRKRDADLISPKEDGVRLPADLDNIVQ